MTKERFYQLKKEFVQLRNPMRFYNYPKMVLGLIEFCKLIPPNAIGLEIGCFAGESTLIMLDSIPGLNLICVDPWSKQYYPGSRIVTAKNLFDKLVSKRVKTLIMESDLAFKYLTEHDPNWEFDFIYIDGNHQYEFVKRDIINSLRLLKSGGILGGHDYKYPKSPGVYKALMEIMGKEPEYVFPDYSFAYRIKIVQGVYSNFIQIQEGNNK